MGAPTTPGIPVVGEAIALHHSYVDRHPTGSEFQRECQCAPTVTAVEAKPSGLTHVWARCNHPADRVMLPLMVRLTPAGYIFNARVGATPVKRSVRIVTTLAAAA